jgi:hypothetical protein
MIDVSELHALAKHEQQPFTDIEQIFRALIGYPHEEQIQDSTRDDRTAALMGACEALIGDETILPRATHEIIALVISGVAGAPGLPAPTYGAAAEAIKGNPEPFMNRLRSA